MSENEAPAAPVETKKKKSKLPMLLALVAVLGGGGFFAMKMRAGGAAKPAVKLGEIIPLEQEFLSNLKEKEVYVRAKIALHMQKGYEKAHLVEKMPAVEDAIYMILSDKSLNEVRTIEGKNELKVEIANSVNAILSDHAALAGSPAEGSKDGEAKEPAPPKKDASKHSDWDSTTGPVLKVYFQSFATQ